MIVVDRDGTLVADSEGPGEVGTSFATPGRPEIGSALAGIGCVPAPLPKALIACDPVQGTGCPVGAACNGLRPVAELMFVDFMGVCFDQIFNQGAKLR